MFSSWLLLGLILPVVSRGADAIDVGGRRELVVDRALVEALQGRAGFRLHAPTRREVAIQYDQPWEGNASGYPTVFYAQTLLAGPLNLPDPAE